MMKASPASAFVVTEPDFQLELLVVPFNAPAQLGEVDEVGERASSGKGLATVFDRLGLAWKALFCYGSTHFRPQRPA
jgi:hypothetical protein